MNTIRTTIAAALLLVLTAHVAFALGETVPALPPVPTVGVSPVLSWALSVLSVVMTILLPIAVALLKQRLDTSNTLDHNTMIDRAVKRGALVAYGNQKAGVSSAQAVADGLAYIKSSVPETLGKVDQATDTHLSHSIAAEVTGLSNTAASAGPAPLTDPGIPAPPLRVVPAAPATKGP